MNSIREWLKLNPRLGDTDLRPLLYLSRGKTLSLAHFDELSREGRTMLEALLATNRIMQPLINQLKALGEVEGEQILNRIMRRARAEQWERTILIQALHIPKAFPNLATSFVNFLNEIPASKRSAPFIPLIRSEAWAEELLKKWGNDNQSPQPVKNAIADLTRRS
jgi:hypothetical protein